MSNMSITAFLVRYTHGRRSLKKSAAQSGSSENTASLASEGAMDSARR